MPNLELLNNLSEKERQAALKILEEMQKNGSSKTLDSIKYAEYREIPVDIETFLTDNRYLGSPWKDASGASKVYPFWMDRLKELFPDNTTTSVNTFIASGARGLGKSDIIAAAIAPYLMYRMLCMKNPLDFYNLKATDKIVFAFMNIKLDLAEEIATSKFQNTVQLSPWFMERGKMTRRNNKDYWVPPEPLSIVIGSQSDDLIGLPVAFAMFDEISFIKNQDIDKQKKKAIDMIDTAIGGMKTRFITRGKDYSLLTLASSKRSDKSFLEEHIKTKLESEKDNVIIVDKAVWEVKPKGTYSSKTFRVAVGSKFKPSKIIPDTDTDTDLWLLSGYSKIIDVPENFRAKFTEDIDRALCDYAGESSTELSKYISGEAVDEIIDSNLRNPFSDDIITVGNAPDDRAQYYNFFDMSAIPKELMSRPLFVHLDMSISGDMTGIAGVWIIGKKPTTDGKPSKDLKFQLAFSVSVEAPKGRQISFEKNRNFIRWLKEAGFNIREITADTFQSYDLLQQLSAEKFNCSILSVDRVDSDRVCKPYQYLKSTVYEKRLIMYRSKRLVEEFVDIERNINTGKIDHTPNFHKDALDAVCGATFTASKYAEEFAYDYGESLELIDEANSADNVQSQRKQITVDFEQELMKLDPLRGRINNINQDKKKEEEETNLDFGFGKREEVYPYISNGVIVF